MAAMPSGCCPSRKEPGRAESYRTKSPPSGDIAAVVASAMTIAAGPASFHLSRVYAQGWNAARQLSADTPVDPKTMATLNPYTSEPERTRWNQGFVNASK